MTSMTGVLVFFSCSMICLSPAPIKVDGSTSHRITSTSGQRMLRHVYHVVAQLVFALWIPGVSRKTICPCSHVYTVCILFLVVCGLLDVIAIFCPISRFISVDFPTFGLPISVTKPLFFICFHIFFLYPSCRSFCLRLRFICFFFLPHDLFHCSIQLSALLF